MFLIFRSAVIDVYRGTVEQTYLCRLVRLLDKKDPTRPHRNLTSVVSLDTRFVEPAAALAVHRRLTALKFPSEGNIAETQVLWPCVSLHEAYTMLSRIATSSVLTVGLFFIPSGFAFDTPLSPEAIREAYFLGQHNDQSTLSFFNPYIRVLPKPENGPYIAEVEVYTPYVQIIETSRRRSMGYSAQQAEQDYRHRHDKLYARIRIDFTETYGALELYRSAKNDREHSGSDRPLPDFYRDFRVGLAQHSGSSHEDQWIEPLRIILQPSFMQNSNHYPFIPEDLGLLSYAATGVSSYAYSSANGFVYPTGWLVWLVYDAGDVASDDATVEVITTDGQHVSVPFDLSRLR